MSDNTNCVEWEKKFDYQFTTFGNGRFLKQVVKSEDVKDFIRVLLGEKHIVYQCSKCNYMISKVAWETIKYRESQYCPRGCEVSLSDFERTIRWLTTRCGGSQREYLRGYDSESQ